MDSHDVRVVPPRSLSFELHGKVQSRLTEKRLAESRITLTQ